MYEGKLSLNKKPIYGKRRALHTNDIPKASFAFSKKLPWFEPTKVITLKTQQHAVNPR